MDPPAFHHQASQEGLLSFDQDPILSAETSAKLSILFQELVNVYEPRQARYAAYQRITLLCLTLEHIQSKDYFLNYLFLFVEAHLSGISDISSVTIDKALVRYDNMQNWMVDEEAEVEASLVAFAENLINSFFLPLKASGKRTPQPTPASFAGLRAADDGIGTREQLSNLRAECLIRDGHRCVVTQHFEAIEGEKRHNAYRSGEATELVDDDGNELELEVDDLEVAHILPHSLTQLPSPSEEPSLPDSKKIALRFLDMFDRGIVHRINGIDIDRPYNAMSMIPKFHGLFGQFRIGFEKTADQNPYSYKIIFHKSVTGRYTDLPVLRTLRVAPGCPIDPPCPRLLAIHLAIGRILALSAAGKHIDQILRDLEDPKVRANGTTNLSAYLGLRLDGWIGPIQVH